MRTVTNVAAVLGAFMVLNCAPAATDPADSGSAGEQTVAAGDTVQLRIGDTARIRGSRVAIAFRGVPEDSRCPADVACVWQGDARVRLAFTSTAADWVVRELHTAAEPQAVTFGEFLVTLVAVAPVPVSTGPIPADEYSIRLEITRR